MQGSQEDILFGYGLIFNPKGACEGTEDKIKLVMSMSFK
jgi:hypothetical protein